MNKTQAKQIKAIQNLLATALAKVETPKQAPEAQLRAFMDKKGYKVQKEETSQYVRKDGKAVPIKVLHYSNGGKYAITSTRFWRAN